MSNLDANKMRKIIQSYGANPVRWPQKDRQLGQAWLTDNPSKARKLLADADALDQMLNTVQAPVGDTVLLQARILKAAKHAAQEGVSHDIAANDTLHIAQAPTLLSSWKAVAATLVLTTGMGFGIGQVAAADTTYSSAEALLSISMQSDYAEADIYGDGS